MSWKHIQFFGSEEEKTELWLNELYHEFERFFRTNTLQVPEELSQELKNKGHFEVAKIIQSYLSKVKG